MDRTALVVGVTGIAGYNTAQALLADGWRVVGLSRAPRYEIPGVEHVYADVLDPASVERAVTGKAITHLFFTTWSRQDTEADNCRVNGAMLANTLEALRRTSRTRARGAGDRSEALPRSVRGVRLGTGRDAVPREPGSAARSRTSTTTRRTSCSPPPRSEGSPGRCTGRTR